MGLSQAWNTTEAYLALARQGRIRLLSPVIFLTCHSMNLKKISGQKTQKNKQKTPPSWGTSQAPPPSSIFLPKFPAEMDQKKNFFFLQLHLPLDYLWKVIIKTHTYFGGVLPRVLLLRSF